MLRLSLSTLRFRASTFVSTFLALALGVALVTAMGLVLAATFDRPEVAPKRYANARAVVVPTGELRVPMPDGDVETAPLAAPPGIPRGLPGELAAAGEVIVDRSFSLPHNETGHPWSAAPVSGYRLTGGAAPASDREVVVAGGHPGERLRIGAEWYTVSGSVAAAGFERAVFFTDHEAARRSPRIDALVLRGSPDDARRIVGNRAKVLAGKELRTLDPDYASENDALVGVNALVGTAGGIAVFVSAFLVASTFAFLVGQRRREFALLRTTGASPAQLRRMVLGEATVVGALAAAAGCAAGWFGGPPLARWLVELELAPPWFAVGSAAWPVLVAFPVGLVMALLGVWAASRRAGTVSPVAALRAAAVSGRGMSVSRWIAGLAVFGGALAMLVTPLFDDPGAALKRKQYVPLVMLLLTAFAVFAPVLVPPVARLVTLPLRRFRGAVGLLAGQGALGAVGRTAAAAAPVLITVGLAGCLLGSAATVDAARIDEQRAQVRSDLVVLPDGTSTLEPSTVDSLLRTPGIEAAATYPTSVYAVEEGTALVEHQATAVDPAALHGMLDLPVVAGSLDDLDDRTIAVDQEWGLRPGDTARVWLADGTEMSLRVVAVLATGAGGNGAYLTTAHAAGVRADKVLVRGGDVDVPGATVATPAEWISATAESGNEASRTGLWVLLGLALVYTGLSVAGTLAMATRGRAGEFAQLRLIGATTGQLLRTVAVDALLVVVLGVLLAAVATGLTLTGLAVALADLGAPVTISLPWATLAGVTGACALVAVLAAVLSAARIGRR